MNKNKTKKLNSEEQEPEGKLIFYKSGTYISTTTDPKNKAFWNKYDEFGDRVGVFQRDLEIKVRD